uniref:pentapeptide repeat-containing protein n=1 Tax=Rothia aeria TaxID=172042 RepID=UPI0036F350EB
FTGSTYQDFAHFTGSTYKGGVDFTGSTYQDFAHFTGSTYKGGVDFTGSTYQDFAHFTGSTYKDGAYFTGSTYRSWADFTGSTYQDFAHFTGSTYQGRADFCDSTYENETDFSGSIFYQETYFGENGYSNSSSCFTNHAPQFYDKKKRKNTLFGSHNNDFTVDIDKGYPIDLDSKGIPLNCKFLTSEQKEYLADKFREIEKTNNKLLEVKDPKEKEELLKKLQALNEELYEWREEATTVQVEDVAAEDTES